jgi:hypothetical protein
MGLFSRRPAEPIESADAQLLLDSIDLLRTINSTAE